MEKGKGTKTKCLFTASVVIKICGGTSLPLLAYFDLSDPVHCDSSRIAQLVSNLTGNALTHGEEQSPVIIQANDLEGKLKISVSNKGTPIPEELQVQLFEPFKKEGDAPGKQGLRLGIYICAEIARAHKSTLSFTSTKEETCFVFIIGGE